MESVRISAKFVHGGILLSVVSFGELLGKMKDARHEYGDERCYSVEFDLVSA